MKKKTKISLAQTLPYILLIAGGIGVICSFILTLDYIQLLKHPEVQLNCDINPIISCGSVMKTPQSSVFGFTNSLAGIVGYVFLATVGLAMLAGAKFKRWFWLLLQVSVTGAIAFTIWFQYQSMVNIHALCPFCMVVWVITIPIFFYVTLYNLRENHFGIPARYKPVSTFILKYHWELLTAWYMILILLLLNSYWYYWKTLL